MMVFRQRKRMFTPEETLGLRTLMKIKLKPVASLPVNADRTSNDLYLYESGSCFPIHDFPLRVWRHTEAVNVPDHLHEFIEIVYISKGSGIHQIKKLNPAGDEIAETFSYGILQGDLFFLMPGEIHSYMRNEKLVLYNILLSSELIADEMTELMTLPGLAGPFAGSVHSPERAGSRRKIHLPFNSRIIAETLLNKIIEELEFKKASFKISAKSALLEFLVFIGRMPVSAWEHSTSVKDAQKHCSSIYQALIHMEKHITDKLTLEELASHANLSLTYFCERFKIVTGMTPWNYLTHLRLEKSKDLLASTNLPISEIAYQTGFCDGSYLAKTFKSHEGLSPTKYRSRLFGA